MSLGDRLGMVSVILALFAIVTQTRKLAQRKLEVSLGGIPIEETRTMPKKGHTEGQTVAVLRQVEAVAGIEPLPFSVTPLPAKGLPRNDPEKF